MLLSPIQGVSIKDVMILGGLAAGLIINVIESVLNGVILAKDMEAAISALGRQMGGGALAMFIAWGFLVGIFAVWLYAAIRPRYGAGPKTAACAGAAVLGPRISPGFSHSDRAASLPETSHGHWPRGGVGRGYRRNACRCVALPRRDSLIGCP